MRDDSPTPGHRGRQGAGEGRGRGRDRGLGGVEVEGGIESEGGIEAGAEELEAPIQLGI